MPTPRKPNLPPTFKSRILEVHSQDPNLTTAEIVEMIGCTAPYVRQLAQSLGLPIPRSGFDPEARSKSLKYYPRHQLAEAVRRQTFVFITQRAALLG